MSVRTHRELSTNMANRDEGDGGVSRRGFLKGALIGLGSGAAMLTIMAGRGLLARRRKVVAEFPDDSIYAPAKNRHDRA
ncbi:MAG: hypothetical protein OXD46_03940 [Chloroflexi bacterium]|nr:hypothetical protein [Chloroflexota bacterium]